MILGSRRHSFVIALFVSILLGTPQKSLAAQKLDLRAAYDEIREVALQVTRMCPPEDCVVVGLGRSPTLVTNFLQNLRPDYAYNLPLSSFRYLPPQLAGKTFTSGLGFHSLLSTTYISKLDSHVDLFLPSSRLGKVKKILVLDYGGTGTSVLSFSGYLENHLKDLKLFQVRVEAGVMTEQSNLSRINRALEEANVISAKAISIKDKSALANTLLNQSSDPFAEYESYEIWNPSSIVRKNPHHETLDAEMKALMKDDPAVTVMRENLKPRVKSNLKSLGQCVLDFFRSLGPLPAAAPRR